MSENVSSLSAPPAAPFAPPPETLGAVQTHHLWMTPLAKALHGGGCWNPPHPTQGTAAAGRSDLQKAQQTKQDVVSAQ